MRSPAAPPAYDAYPLIRAVGPPDVPFDGVLARAPDGRTVLLVDRESLDGWPGWTAPVDSHILAPMDLLRRPDGHDVVLPAAQLRADRLLARRTGAGVPLTEGEIVTLAVSAVRGTATAIDEDLAEATGSWWITDDGKPVLACGSGDSDVLRASAVLLRTLAEHASRAALAAVLRELADAVVDPRTFPRRADDDEEALFAHADPEPLTLEVLGPVRTPAPRDAVDARRERRRAADSWWHRLAGAADGGLADLVSDQLDRMRRRPRRERRRLRPVWLAAGAAAVVLGIGLAWPDTTDPATRAGDASPPPAAATDPTATATQPAAADEIPPDLPAAEALTALLETRRSCPDAACLSATQEDAEASFPDGAFAAENPAVTLLDDFGGLAVLRVDAESAASQFVTVAATETGWRIRDVFDAADPPT
ncbi:hypothetical protein ACTU3I_17710 [Microbacterium sp. RD1]|uniref:hypothetical protein n=1 Tax=Microbacterium sp. RD1 TaxID=3457313 RepID=UPI003FA57B30